MSISYAVLLKPSDIRFTEKVLPTNFDNGIPLNETVAQVLNGETALEDIPVIDVIWYHEKWEWYTMDNRRLWVFQELERDGICNYIPCRRIEEIEIEVFDLPAKLYRRAALSSSVKSQFQSKQRVWSLESKVNITTADKGRSIKQEVKVSYHERNGLDCELSDGESEQHYDRFDKFRNYSTTGTRARANSTDHSPEHVDDNHQSSHSTYGNSRRAGLDYNNKYDDSKRQFQVKRETYKSFTTSNRGLGYHRKPVFSTVASNSDHRRRKDTRKNRVAKEMPDELTYQTDCYHRESFSACERHEEYPHHTEHWRSYHNDRKSPCRSIVKRESRRYHPYSQSVVQSRKRYNSTSGLLSDNSVSNRLAKIPRQSSRYPLVVPVTKYQRWIEQKRVYMRQTFSLRAHNWYNLDAKRKMLEGLMFTCGVCYKTFKTHLRLEQHMECLTHWACARCNRLYASNTALGQHKIALGHVQV